MLRADSHVEPNTSEYPIPELRRIGHEHPRNPTRTRRTRPPRQTRLDRLPSPSILGAADVIALRAGSRTQLIEVKSTAKGPYEHFGPAARTRLSLTAKLAGADALLAWWPPRGKLRFIPEHEWPRT